MNKTVALVNEWADFENKHPEGNLEDFCRYYLISKREKAPSAPISGGLVPPFTNLLLMKILGRITRLFHIYAENAIADLKIKQFEDFTFLNTVYQMQEPRKTEVIYQALSELSTGIDILNRLKKMGYVTEKSDPEDRRSKRVKVTAKGEKVLFECYNVFGRLNDMFTNDLPEEDMKLCIQLLKNLEIKFSNLWQQHRSRSFEEVFSEMMPGYKMRKH